MPPDSRLINWLEGAFRDFGQGRLSKEADRGHRIPLQLSQIEPGQRACVVEVETGTKNELLKLMAMGLLPGAKLLLLRRTPSIVYQSGFSQFALDAELASRVLVEIIECEEATGDC